MTKNKDLVNLFGQMGRNMLGCGKMAYRMEKGVISQRQVQNAKDNGKMENVVNLCHN